MMPPFLEPNAFELDNRASRLVLAFQLYLLCAFAVVVSASSARAQEVPTLVVTKSAIANLAEPVTREIQTRAFLFIPAGTRALLYKKTDPSGVRSLLLMEFGVWAYLKKGNYEDLAKYGAEGKILFMTRNFPLRVSQNLTGVLTPSEWYKVIEEGETIYKIKLDNRKFPDLRDDWTKAYWITKDVANVVDLGDDMLEAEIDYFTRGFIGKVFEFWKPCRETDVRETTYKGGVSVDVSFFERFKLLLDAQAEKTRVREFNESEIVHRRYYTKKHSGGAYSLTKIEICRDGQRGQIEYHWITPEPNEYIIDKSWATSNNLRIDDRTSEVIVSCYDEYDKYTLALAKDLRVPLNDIPFLISLTARWQEASNYSTCSQR